MKFSIVAVLITSVIGVALISLPFENAQATSTTEQTQTGVVLGYGGQPFGLVDISTNGRTTEVSIATDFLPPPGIKYDEHLVNAYTYTDLIITVEPANDLDPGGAWAQTVGAYLLVSPFGK
ncbi:MAG: hypothetical protein K0S67_469 [Nitrososphaeraceae archaeon]|nr:hypothetical protein [Nitrososphaeraceae archaeon]